MGIKVTSQGERISIRRRGLLEADSKVCLSGNVRPLVGNTPGTRDTPGTPDTPNIECIKLGARSLSQADPSPTYRSTDSEQLATCNLQLARYMTGRCRDAKE